MVEKANNLRSSKWTFLIYKDSTPSNYLEILNNIHVPYMLSPWHDKDIDDKTGKLKKAHRHGVLYFETLKSQSQVIALLQPLNGPEYIEIVHSTVGIYDYFTHAETPSKEPYNIDVDHRNMANGQPHTVNITRNERDIILQVSRQ